MDQILLRIRVRLLGLLEGTSGGAGKVLGDIGADEGKLDRIKGFCQEQR